MTEVQSVDVVHDADDARFVARIDGVFAGASYYWYRRGRMVLIHTETQPEFEGRGVGSSLTRMALEAAKENDELVVPLCPFVESYIDRYEEYADLLDKEMFQEMRS